MSLSAQKGKVLAIKIIYIVFLLIGFAVLAKELSLELISIGWECFFFCFCIIYLSLSSQKLSGTEKGIKEFLGIPYAYTDSGLRFAFFLVEKIVRYPKELQQVEVAEQKVLTTSGTEELNNEYCSSVSIKVNGTFYFFWPDGDDLITAYQTAPKPDHPEEIKSFFERILMNGIRTAASKITWRACSQPIFQEKITNELKKRESALTKAGITNFRVEITNVDLPQQLEDAIPQPQIADLYKAAEIKKGEAEMEKIRLVGVGEAAARKAIFEEISARGDNGLAYEMLLTLRKMADGKSSTIFYGLPSEISGILNRVLGNKNGSEEIINALGGKEGIQKLAENIQKMIGK